MFLPLLARAKCSRCIGFFAPTKLGTPAGQINFLGDVNLPATGNNTFKVMGRGFSYYDQSSPQDTRNQIRTEIGLQEAIEPCPCGSSCLELWSNKTIRMVDSLIEVIPGNRFIVRCLLCNFAGPERDHPLDAIKAWNGLQRSIDEVSDVPF